MTFLLFMHFLALESGAVAFMSLFLVLSKGLFHAERERCSWFHVHAIRRNTLVSYWLRLLTHVDTSCAVSRPVHATTAATVDRAPAAVESWSLPSRHQS